MYNGGCFGDDLPGTIHFNLPCFVRNVLVRTLSDAILDIGSSQTISTKALSYLDICQKRGEHALQEKQLRLSARLRREIGRKLTGGIAQLSTTYLTTVDFRDRVLLKCKRGRELKRLYDVHLGEIYRVTALNLPLFYATARVWLAVHPFVADMVSITRDTREDGGSGTMRMSAQQYRSCLTLLRKFRAASSDEKFRQALASLEQEFAGYKGLTASEAVARLTGSTQRT
jgi:hypothetical protein